MGITKFDVGDKVITDFDYAFFDKAFGVVREINIKISSVGVHIEYQVADVVCGTVLREFRLDEANLEKFEEGEK